MLIQTPVSKRLGPYPRASRVTTLSEPSNRTHDAVLVSGAVAIGGVSAALALSDTVKTDKYKHMGIVGAGTVALGSMGVPPALSAAICFGGATIAKELGLDLAFGRGTPSVHDAAANLAGAMAGYAVLKLSEELKR